MKQYVKTDECRREALLKNFDNSSEVSYPQPMHLCCGNCEKSVPGNQLIADSLQDSPVVYMKIHLMFQYQRGL